jgi:hypothetical protein
MTAMLLLEQFCLNVLIITIILACLSLSARQLALFFDNNHAVHNRNMNLISASLISLNRHIGKSLIWIYDLYKNSMYYQCLLQKSELF